MTSDRAIVPPKLPTQIAREGKIILPRPNAEWLKEVKSRCYDYEDLLKIAEERHEEMEETFALSDLPEKPDRKEVSALLLELRDRFL